MKTNILIYLYLILIGLQSCSTDDLSPLIKTETLSGRWEGTLTANNWVGHFDFIMDLEQDGSEVEGTSKISFQTRSAGEAQMILAGKFRGSTLSFDELSILQHTGEQFSGVWCIKSGLLEYTEINGTKVLSGSWTDASQCRNSGEINLTLN